MTEYLGISLVIVVAGLVIAVLAKLVTGNILDEIERVRRARFERRVKILSEAIKEGLGESAKAMEKYMKNIKEAVAMDKEYVEKGETDKANKMAKEALKTTVSEFKNDIDGL